MEKISHILPSNARVTTADVMDAQPARPGAPSFGRPMGRDSLRDRLTLSQKALDSKLTGEAPTLDAPVTYKNHPESAKQKMIEKLSQDFFNPKTEARGSEETSSEQVVKSIEDSQDLPAATLKHSPLSPQGNRGPQES